MTVTSSPPPPAGGAGHAPQGVQPEPDCDLAELLLHIDGELRLFGAGGESCALGYGPDLPGGPDLWEVRPAASLLGWTAPRNVERLVVVCSGAATACDDRGRPLRWPADEDSMKPAAVSLVVAVDRQGRMVARLDAGEGVGARQPTGGRMVDILLRCLELPTPPEERDPAELLACIWLGAILATARGRHRHRGRLHWSEVLCLHPASHVLILDGGAGLPDCALETVVQRAPQIWTWGELRRATVANGSLSELCPPLLADWMDDGMYARWTMGETAPFEGLLAAVRDRVDTDAYRRLTGAFEQMALEVPSESW
ncbi:MAG: hypothetical protein M0Z42_19105 [Actinomycetota bacterium]|nr:hypothetical protein [Actinomycetota bacterium]